MSRVTFGKTSWDNPAPGASGNDDFLRLQKDGAYTVRIVGDAPFEYATHWTQDAEGNNRRVNCAGRGCVLCEEGMKASIRYLIEVVDVDSGKPKIVEFGPQVYNQIRALRANRHWGDPRGYSIVIDKNKSRGPSGMYMVTPLSKEPLDDEIKAAVVEFKDRIKEVIAKVSEPSTNEEILQKLGRVEAADSNESWSDNGSEEASSSSEEEEDFDF